jgi:dTDP-4-dehydrorhamnose reductase
VYAETKRSAERAVLEAHPGAIVARVNFYGWSASGTRSLAEFFVNNLSAGSPVRGFADVTFCPMLVNHLAGTLMGMLERRLQGLFHAVGPEPISKYEFGLRIARKFGFDEALITPESVEKAGLAARRAHNLNLSVDKLSTALGEPLPSFSTGLEMLHTQFVEHYPQKIRSYLQPSGAAGVSAVRGSRPDRVGQE